MRLSNLAFIALTCSSLIACGGSTPAPEAPTEKGESDPSEGSGEESMAAEIDSYLEAEGEGASEGESADTPADGETAADAETATAPKSTERRDQIWALIKAKRESVLNCYKMAKKSDPKLGTKLAVRFTLKPDGSLKTPPAVVPEMSDITHPDVVKCATEVIQSIQYPEHPKGMETTFTYPYGF